MVPQEDTRRRTETKRKRKDCREKSQFTQNYDKKRAADHGSEQWTRGQKFQGRNQNHNNDRPTRNIPTSYHNFSPRPYFAYGNKHPNNGSSYDQRRNQSFIKSDGNRSPNGSFNNQNGNWRNIGNSSRFPSTQRRDSSQNDSYCQSGSDQSNNCAFCRSDNRPTTGFTPYEEKFPQNNNQTFSNVVRITRNDDTNNKLSDLCPLNN